MENRHNPYYLPISLPDTNCTHVVEDPVTTIPQTTDTTSMFGSLEKGSTSSLMNSGEAEYYRLLITFLKSTFLIKSYMSASLLFLLSSD